MSVECQDPMLLPSSFGAKHISVFNSDARPLTSAVLPYEASLCSISCACSSTPHRIPHGHYIHCSQKSQNAYLVHCFPVR